LSKKHLLSEATITLLYRCSRTRPTPSWLDLKAKSSWIQTTLER